MSERYAGRSVHGAPQHARRFAEHPLLQIDASGERSLGLLPGDLSHIERVSFLHLFSEEARQGWQPKDWSGIPLSRLIALVNPGPEDRWMQVLGGPLASVLPIEDAGNPILADCLDGEPIPVELGGPYRLVCPILSYNLSVKWVDRILLFEDEPDRSAERVAVARQRARDARQ
ncbi:MAG: molybdopterin-dependent oxidoreductase [Thermomicrobiales bacterium]|nr:molybdopterin-dependent oxidoreductase [Thermomicrobiales bacterium]